MKYTLSHLKHHFLDRPFLIMAFFGEEDSFAAGAIWIAGESDQEIDGPSTPDVVKFGLPSTKRHSPPASLAYQQYLPETPEDLGSGTGEGAHEGEDVWQMILDSLPPGVLSSWTPPGSPPATPGTPPGPPPSTPTGGGSPSTPLSESDFGLTCDDVLIPVTIDDDHEMEDVRKAVPPPGIYVMTGLQERWRDVSPEHGVPPDVPPPSTPPRRGREGYVEKMGDNTPLMVPKPTLSSRRNQALLMVEKPQSLPLPCTKAPALMVAAPEPLPSAKAPALMVATPKSLPSTKAPALMVATPKSLPSTKAPALMVAKPKSVPSTKAPTFDGDEDPLWTSDAESEPLRKRVRQHEVITIVID